MVELWPLLNTQLSRKELEEYLSVDYSKRKYPHKFTEHNDVEVFTKKENKEKLLFTYRTLLEVEDDKRSLFLDPRNLLSAPIYFYKFFRLFLPLYLTHYTANFKRIKHRKRFEENNAEGIVKLIESHGGIDSIQPISDEPSYFIRCGDKKEIIINYLTDATLTL